MPTARHGKHVLKSGKRLLDFQLLLLGRHLVAEIGNSSLNLKRIANHKVKIILDFYRKLDYIILMNKSEMLKEISILHETLKDCVLTIADKVAIRNEIGDLQDKVALLNFRNEGEDIDFGHHSEWE